MDDPQTAQPSRLQSWRWNLGAALGGKLGIPSVADHTRRRVEAAECATGLDLGCGVSSHLSPLRPKLKTYGIDADEASVEESRRRGVHDGYAVGDIISMPIDELRSRLLDATGHDRFDVVTAYGVIEHVTKRDGWELLDKCEALANKLVIIETPNGFVPQGPEFGNPLQRHLSGWWEQDFQGRGFEVIGTGGTRHFRGYMGEPKIAFPGARLLDQVVLSHLFRVEHKPRHAFNLTAVKDLRGVPARYATREDFHLGRRVA